MVPQTLRWERPHLEFGTVLQVLNRLDAVLAEIQRHEIRLQEYMKRIGAWLHLVTQQKCGGSRQERRT